MITKHFKLNGSEYCAKTDRETLVSWLRGIITTDQAQADIERRNVIKFDGPRDFTEWAESLGYFHEAKGDRG